MSELPESPDTEDTALIVRENEQNVAKEKIRNIVGFFFLGILTPFGTYWIMAAAFDLLELNKTEQKSGFYCHANSTGIIIITGVIPDFLVRLICPWFIQAISYHVRFAFTVILCTAAVLVVGLAPSLTWTLIGIVMGSITTSVVEITCLSLVSHFKSSAIPAYVSGTAASGIISSLLYAGATTGGLAPKSAMFILMIVPIGISITFWAVLELPQAIRISSSSIINFDKGAWRSSIQDSSSHLTFKGKLKLLIPLLKHMIPLFIVYLAYFSINQALFELLYYNLSWLTQARQYRWFQFVVCCGELIGKSSVALFHMKKIWIPAAIEVFIFLALLLEVIYTYIPTIWLTLIIILLEGMFLGIVYANAIYNVSQEVNKEYVEFSMGLLTAGGTSGTIIASGIALPIHKQLCLFKKHN